MKFRVDKNLSVKKMEALFTEQAHMYCDQVLAKGCMATDALAVQRVMMQYHEAWLEKQQPEITVLPGQTKMFEEDV